MEEIYPKVVDAMEKGLRSVLATVVKQAGPSPRGVGSKCLLLEDGTLEGTIGGGRLEADTLAEAREMFGTFRPRRLRFTLKGRDVAGTDMLCGGDVEVFVEPVSPSEPIHLSIARKALDIRRRQGAGIVATLIDPELWEEGSPPKLLIQRGGEKIGALPGGPMVEGAALEAMDRVLRTGQPEILACRDELGRSLEVYLEPIAARPSLFVFGGGHVSKEIVPLAHHVGFDVVVIDDRAEFSHPEDFPGAKEVRHLPFEDVMEHLSVSDSCYIVIVTRGHLYDKEVLSQALKTPAGYIGMIGSRRKRNMVYQKLQEEGFTREDLARVCSPIGVDIGAETPAEIAVSIVAELIKVRAAKK